MIIIKCLYHQNLKMKKILYLWLSLVVIISSVFSITLAQGEGQGTTSDSTTSDSTTTNLTTQETEIGINLSTNCLRGVWKNCFEYEKLVWIDGKQKTKYTATSIAKDVMYAATYAVWTVLTIVIIYCGLMYIYASRWGKDTSSYTRWLTNAAIWAILVWWAYAIIRLIQYVARW